MVIDTYHQKYKEFENLVATVTNVDSFMSDVFRDIQKAQGLLKHKYRPFREGVEEFRRHLSHNIQGDVTQILPMGWPGLFKMGIPPKQGLMVISGLEGSGKTQLLLQILLGRVIQMKANNQPGCVAFNSYEMPGWKLAKRLACCLAGVDGHKLALGEYEKGDEEVQRVQEALEFLETLPIYYDDSQLMTSDAIHWQSNALHANCGPLTDLGIDYAELVPDSGESEELRVSRIYKNAARLTTIGATAYMVSQFNRGAQMTETKRGGKGRLRYTSVAQHIAHVIAELYNIPAMVDASEEFTIPEGYSKDKAYLIVEKNRDGPTGAVPLEWDGPSTRFADSSLSKKFGPQTLYENLDRVQSMVMGDF
jgi:replicative DNA helicase